MPSSATIAAVPVVDAAGRVVSYISRVAAALLPPCRVVRSRRGHVVRVIAVAESLWTRDLIRRGKPSRWGQAFRQAVGDGHVAWSLRGVEGSR